MKCNLYFALLIFLGCIVLTSCKKDPEPEPSKTPEEIATEKLAGESSKTWVVTGGSVTHSGQNVTSEYANFEITFSSNGKSYTTSNGGNLFDASGNWSFAGSNFDIIVLTGNQPAAGQDISFSGTSGTLVLEFNVPAPSGGRVLALAGDYRFELKEK